MPATIKVKGVDVGSNTSRVWVLRDVEARPKFFSARLADLWRRNLLLGLCVALLSAASFASPAATQDEAPAQTAQIAKQANAWFENYKFRDGETITRLRIHYATLGELHRNAAGNIDNAVLVLHWTGADGLALRSPLYMKALFDPGRPLDARRYYLIFPGQCWTRQIEQAERWTEGELPKLRLSRHC